MIYELIGPMAVGKTTVAPLVADRMGIPFYRGQGFHGLDDQPLGTTQTYMDRVAAVVRNPRLTVGALGAVGGTGREKLNFALNLARRDRLEARGARRGGGIVESGPVHAICQYAAWARDDLTELGRLIHHADVYVRLHAPPEVVTRRLAARGGMPEQYVAVHGDWVERYDEYVNSILAVVSRPVVDVDANQPPQQVANEIVTALTLVAP